MTAYSTACHFARRAADLCRYNGISSPGFSRLPESFMGACWQFDHAGQIILLNSNGTVNQPATKARREAARAFMLADLVKSAKEAIAMAAAVDSALAAIAPAPRAATKEEQESMSDLEARAEAAERAGQYRMAAACWDEGAAICRAARQLESASLWASHAAAARRRG